jgi:hypothetical protein
VTIYGVRVLEALDVPRTLMELMSLTGFGVRYIARGISEARMEGHTIVARSEGRGKPTTYRRAE